MIPRPWSDEEERMLIEMRTGGKSFKLIARALGRSWVSCASRWYSKLKKASRDEGFPGTRRAHDAQ